jgi:hypothetical protein
MAITFPPVENARPAPVRTTTWTSGSSFTGTEGSKQPPSSGESVSPGNFLFDFYKPAFSAGWSCTLVIGANAGSRSEWPSAQRYSIQVSSLYVAGFA